MISIVVDDRRYLLRETAFYGARNDRDAREYLYRLEDGRWALQIVSTETLQASGTIVSGDDALAWLIEARRFDAERGGVDPVRRTGFFHAPESAVPYEELRQGQFGSEELFLPTGTLKELTVPVASRVGIAILNRQNDLLRPEPVLQRVLWQPPSRAEDTVGFRGEGHEVLLVRLMQILERRLVESPQIRNLQGLQDHGCDVLIEWPASKYGVQVKCNGDVEKAEFASKTLAQIQDSKQHGLARLYVVLAADVATPDSSGKVPNLEKVRAFESRISSQNDPPVRRASGACVGTLSAGSRGTPMTARLPRQCPTL